MLGLQTDELLAIVQSQNKIKKTSTDRSNEKNVKASSEKSDVKKKKCPALVMELYRPSPLTVSP